MSREIITRTTCAHCGNTIDIATEDLRWERISDNGETEDNPTLHDFTIWQDIICPHCGYLNDVLIYMKGESEANINDQEIKVANSSEARKMDADTNLWQEITDVINEIIEKTDSGEIQWSKNSYDYIGKGTDGTDYCLQNIPLPNAEKPVKSNWPPRKFDPVLQIIHSDGKTERYSVPFDKPQRKHFDDLACVIMLKAIKNNSSTD